MKILRDILLIIAAIFIDVVIIVLSIISYKISTVFGIVISIRAGYIKSCGCVHSLNEQNITKLLQDNNIEFATQYTFPDLFGLNGGHLRFDFAVFNNNHELSHLIEYNGQQHYIQPDGDWGNNFETMTQHDKLKQEYCQKHNIRLIIIPFDMKYSLEDLL